MGMQPEVKPCHYPHRSFPLAYAQRGLWLLHQQSPRAGGLFIVARVQSHVDPGRLRDAARAMVARHDALRTFVVREGEDLRQVVHADAAVDFRGVVSEHGTEVEARRAIDDHMREPYSLSTG